MTVAVGGTLNPNTTTTKLKYLRKMMASSHEPLPYPENHIFDNQDNIMSLFCHSLDTHACTSLGYVLR